jgi:hypothetical protein
LATIGLLWTAVIAGVWAALGIVAGIPLDALTWISFGLVVAGAATQDSVDSSEKVPLP